MKKKVLKKILRILIFVVVSLNVFLLNVVMHEIGHYLIANYHDLKPEIELNIENIGDLGFSLEEKTIASTSFNSPNSENILIAISFMGPVMNLVLGVAFSIFFMLVSNKKTKLIFLVGIIISLLSFVTNLLPFEGTDGNIIFGVSE